MGNMGFGNGVVVGKVFICLLRFYMWNFYIVFIFSLFLVCSIRRMPWRAATKSGNSDAFKEEESEFLMTDIFTG